MPKDSLEAMDKAVNIYLKEVEVLWLNETPHGCYMVQITPFPISVRTRRPRKDPSPSSVGISASCYVTQTRECELTEKKLPMTHSKIHAIVRSRGPTKKKMPITGERPSAPPHPISTMENVNVEITKPTKPSGVGFANLLL